MFFTAYVIAIHPAYGVLCIIAQRTTPNGECQCTWPLYHMGSIIQIIPYGEYPSCLHTTLASLLSQKSSQMVPQVPLTHTSTLPWRGIEEPARRISPCVQCTAQGGTYIARYCITDTHHLNTTKWYMQLVYMMLLPQMCIQLFIE